MAWVIRYLGAEQFGQFSYAMSVAALVAAIATLGLNNIVVRNLLRDSPLRPHILATAGALKFGGGLLATLVAVGVIWTINDNQTTRLLVLLISGGFVFQALQVPDFWFQSQVLSKYAVFARIGGILTTSAAKIALILGGASLVAFGWVEFANHGIIGIGMCIAFYLKGPSDFKWEPKAEVARDLLKDSWPLILAGLSIALYMKIDQVMLGELTTAREVGIYASAATISEVWYFIPGVLASSVFPAIVRAKESGDAKKYQRRMQLLYDIVVLLAYGVALPLTLLAGVIVTALFGDEFRGAVPILRIHIWAFVFVGLGLARTRWLLAENFTRFAMGSTVAGAVINIALNLILIPKFGGVGAAWATLIAYAVAGYFSAFILAGTRSAFHQMTRALCIPFRLAHIRREWRELR
jgi:O-antigen/teichoic acid export membrane protein